MGSSAGCSPFRVAPPPESPPCPCLRQLVCLSISSSVLALLSWHHFWFSLTHALVSLLPWHHLLCLLGFSASLVFWCLLYPLLSICPFSVCSLFLGIWFCRDAMHFPGSLWLWNGSILYEPAVTSKVQSVTPPTQVTTAAPLLPKPCRLRWVQVSRLPVTWLVFLDENSKGKASEPWHGAIGHV